MDLDKIFIRGASKTKIGGQAVLEGIMMQGTDRTAVAIRLPNGNVHIKTEKKKEANTLRKIPFLRGIFIFFDAMVNGMKTLLYSAEVLENADESGVYEKDRLTLWLEKNFGEKRAFNIAMYISVVLAIVFTIGIFVIAPTGVANLFGFISKNEIFLNLAEGIFRIFLFVLYVWLISKMEDIRTVFKYHGAEHKCIHCFENGLELTPSNCKGFETLHPRCGTSFLMFVMILSLLLFSLLGWPNLFLRITSRLLLIPVVAGMSYELLRWAGNSDSWIVKVLSIPGLLLQKLTTVEPDEEQLEVAILAMNAVLVPETTEVYVEELNADDLKIDKLKVEGLKTDELKVDKLKAVEEF